MATRWRYQNCHRLPVINIVKVTRQGAPISISNDRVQPYQLAFIQKKVPNWEERVSLSRLRIITTNEKKKNWTIWLESSPQSPFIPTTFFEIKLESTVTSAKKEVCLSVLSRWLTTVRRIRISACSERMIERSAGFSTQVKSNNNHVSRAATCLDLFNMDSYK